MVSCDRYETGPTIDALKGLFFYRHKKAIIYSRIALLWLAAHVFSSQQKHTKLRRDVGIRALGDLAVRLQVQPKDYLTSSSFDGLFRALHRQAIANGLLTSKRVSSRPTRAAQNALDSLIDWTWVAEELQKEVERHGHRAKHRHAELCYGRPWEEIELAAEEHAAAARKTEMTAQLARLARVMASAIPKPEQNAFLELLDSDPSPIDPEALIAELLEGTHLNDL